MIARRTSINRYTGTITTIMIVLCTAFLYAVSCSIIMKPLPAVVLACVLMSPSVSQDARILMYSCILMPTGI